MRSQGCIAFHRWQGGKRASLAYPSPNPDDLRHPFGAMAMNQDQFEFEVMRELWEIENGK